MEQFICVCIKYPEDKSQGVAKQPRKVNNYLEITSHNITGSQKLTWNWQQTSKIMNIKANIKRSNLTHVKGIFFLKTAFLFSN